jgi:hypothetical protein
VSDDAARLCTLPYRAPELFDPVVGSVVDVRYECTSRRTTLISIFV